MEMKDIQSAVDGIKSETIAAIDAAKSEWKKYSEKLEAQGADSADVKTQLERAIKRLDGIEAEWTRKAADIEKSMEKKSLGELFTDSDIFKQFKTVGRGTFVYNVPGKSFFPHELANGPVPEFKTTITSATVGSSTPGILLP